MINFFFKPIKTVFFKRQSNIIAWLFENRFLENGDQILMPSYICSEVIDSFQEKNIKIIFYQLDENLNCDLIQIKEKLEKNNIKYLYIFENFNSFIVENDLFKFLRKNDINIILDKAHKVSFSKELNSKKNDINKNNILIELFSPRKFFRLREGTRILLNKREIFTLTNINLTNFIIDKFRRSVLLRTILNKSILKIFTLKKTIKKDLYNQRKDEKQISSFGVSNLYHYYYDKYNKTSNLKYFHFYCKYLDLFKEEIYNCKLNKEFSSNKYWLIPFRKTKKIMKILKKLDSSLINPFQSWPDNNIYLTKEDKKLRNNFIFFRYDCLVSNNFAYSFLKNIYDD